MEKLSSSMPEREIMPPDLFRHYVESRKKAYAGGGENVYVPDSKIPGFKLFTGEILIYLIILRITIQILPRDQVILGDLK